MRVGMVGTRFAGLDGVTLESAKIAKLARRAGHELAWFAGERGSEFSPGVTVEEAHFTDAAELSRQAEYFGRQDHRQGLVEGAQAAAERLTSALRQFVSDFSIDVLLPQNALAIPMQLPLAMAISRVISDGAPAVAHHHDFAWERSRFDVCSVPELIDRYFPPVLTGLHHWVINSIAKAELARRRGVDADVIPNVMDFGGGAPHGDAGAFRRAAGVADDVAIVLQPTRVVPRKGIETTIELAAAVGGQCAVVVTHEEGDEGLAYGAALREQAQRSEVELRFITADGLDGAPALADAYAAADLVAFPSHIEGFGNALLEAFFFRRPVLVRRYPVYVADIAPTGVRCIEIDQELSATAIDHAERWLGDPSLWNEAVETNFDVGVRHFSYEAIQGTVARSLRNAGTGGH